MVPIRYPFKYNSGSWRHGQLGLPGDRMKLEGSHGLRATVHEDRDPTCSPGASPAGFGEVLDAGIGPTPLTACGMGIRGTGIELMPVGLLAAQGDAISRIADVSRPALYRHLAPDGSPRNTSNTHRAQDISPTIEERGKG